MSYAQHEAWKKLPLATRRKLSKAAHEKTRDRSERGALERQQRLDNVAVFDVETDPFDNAQPDAEIRPFLGVLYTAQYDPVIIWEDDPDTFIDKVLAQFDMLPGRWTIYAHNGGRFDWMFFLHKLRGKVSFKGRSLMTAQYGRHELRDSFHLLPVKLAALQKDEIDYAWMSKELRHQYRQKIIDYCVADCRYLHQHLIAFLEKYGFCLTIGQASMRALKVLHKFDRFNERLDADIRRFYHGGRVECLQGAGKFIGDYKLYDINSAYPDAMANHKHPHTTNDISWRYDEEPNEHTRFVRLRCRNNGALITRAQALSSKSILAIAQSVHPGVHETEGEFMTTIWEHDAALRNGLISDVEYLECIDFPDTCDFKAFIMSQYEPREECKKVIFENAVDAFLLSIAKRDSTFYKLMMNNPYGKFAQNPRQFRDKFILDPGAFPDGYLESDETAWESDEFWSDEKHLFTIWSKPAPDIRFNNVAIAASITGCVRAKLIDAIANAIDPIYCDTDSLLCKGIRNVEISQTKLGAWNHEADFDEVIIAGKKLYAARNTVTGKTKFASKGVFGLKWDDYERMISGQVVESVAFGVTIHKSGHQEYMRKKARQTAPKRKAV